MHFVIKMEIKKVIEIPKDVEILLDEFVIVKGPNGELKKKINNPLIKIEKENNKIIVKAKKVNKKHKRVVGTAVAHIKNMIKGALKNYKCKLKICSGHFPMNVAITNNEIVIRNFLGEKYPRTLKLSGNVNLTLNKDIITIEGPDKEEVGLAAASIEKLTAIKNRDRRRFQDGIFIIEKPK